MPDNKSSKGNPAGKRMGNAKLKARRAASWARGQRRKLMRTKAQKEREANNQKILAEGGHTPWQEAKKRRYARRHPE